MTGRPLDAATPPPVVRCPRCRTDSATTASKVIDANTYWRCLTCGEVWNVGRRDVGTRHGWRP